MEPITKTVGENLLRIRNSLGMSLQQLSEATGVSKTMLGAVERGEINPTITTLWKISRGLKMPVSWLLAKNNSRATVIKADECTLAVEEDKIKIYTIFEFDPNKRIEVFLKVFQPGGYLESEGHSMGVEEYLMVNSGEMRIEVNGEQYELMEGDSIRFAADTPHRYWGSESSTTRAHTIFYYPDKSLV